MSFFFAKKKKTAPKKVCKKPSSTSIKNSKDTLNRLSCQVCPLNKAHNLSPKMPPAIAEETDIYILGEQVSHNDDKKGSPLTGQVGKILSDLIGNTDKCSFDNTIRDYDPDHKAEKWVAMECCRSLIMRSIEHAKPKLILGLGILPLQWMLASSDMIGLRGRIFAVQIGSHPCYFMPTYHPEFVIDSAYNDAKPLHSKLGHCLKFDIAKAKRLALSLPPPTIDTPQAARAGVQAFNGKGAGQLADVLNLISKACRARQKAIDLETSCLRPYKAGAKILTVAISYDDTNFAFALDHKDAEWSAKQKEQLKEALTDFILSEGKIIAQNASFECEWLIFLLGKDTIVHDAWECTMMQSHFLDERRGKRGGNDEQFKPNPYQALDFLVKQYFGINFKSLYKIDRKNMADADLAETLLYNGADTKYTLRLYKTQTTLLALAGLDDAYKEAVERQPAVALMQSIGIGIDQKENRKLKDRLDKELLSISKSINNQKVVKTFILDRKSFNVASNPDVIKIFKDYIKVGGALLNAEGKETTDKSALAKIAHPLARLVEDHRNRSKIKSTYVDVFTYGSGSFIHPDNRIHPSFNTTFAETGRTSSDEPNQQNWPARSDKRVRKQVVAPKGSVLVAFDYGQLEACTSAMCTKDKVLVKALWEDYDIHMEWARKAAHIYPEFIGGIHNINNKDLMKGFRSRIKNKLVFPVIFGASNKSVAGYLNAPQDKIDKLMSEFWQTFTGLSRWQKEVMRDYYNTGFVSSLTGRRRHYPLSKNQAINYPIQSVACDIVCRAMVNLSRMAASSGKWYLHPIMNIHDDLTFTIPDNDKILDESIELIYRTMLTPGYDFINVPLSVTCSVGNNWLEMDEIGKFYSNKDL